MGAWGTWKGFQGNVYGDVDCDADCVVDGDLDGDVDVDGDVNFGVDVHVPVHVVDVDYIHAVHVFHKSQHFGCRSANIHRKKFLFITKTLLGKGWRWCLTQTPLFPPKNKNFEWNSLILRNFELIWVELGIMLQTKSDHWFNCNQVPAIRAKFMIRRSNLMLIKSCIINIFIIICRPIILQITN